MCVPFFVNIHADHFCASRTIPSAAARQAKTHTERESEHQGTVCSHFVKEF